MEKFKPLLVFNDFYVLDIRQTLIFSVVDGCSDKAKMVRKKIIEKCFHEKLSDGRPQILNFVSVMNIKYANRIFIERNCRLK